MVYESEIGTQWEHLIGPVRELGDRRRIRMDQICTAERKDASITAVCIGIKCLNDVGGFGLGRLKEISQAWGAAIREYQSSADNRYAHYPLEDMPYAGDIVHDIDGEFADLSERRRRKIKEWIIAERKVSQYACVDIGFDIIRNMTGWRDEIRMPRLKKQWYSDLRNLWEDRDVQQDRLKAWLEEIGFLFDGKSLQSYLNEEGKPVRKKTAERLKAEQDAREARAEARAAKKAEKDKTRRDENEQ